MARISRITQAIFGTTGNVGTAGFGAAAAGTTTTGLATSTTLSTIMSAGAWASGWLTATLGASKFPAVEDMNALNYAITTQLAYLFQSGIPEYDAGTTYYTNNVCIKAGTYQIYGSKINANIGNALPSGVSDANWQYLGDLSTLSSSPAFFIGGVSTGSANAQVLASPTPSGFSLSLDGATVALTAGFTNTTTTPTFAINGTTATVVKKNGTSGLIAVAAGDITAGESIFLTRNITGSCYVLTDTPPLGTASLKAATDNAQNNVASTNGAFVVGRPVIASDTLGTIKDGGAYNFYQNAPTNPTGVSGTTLLMQGLAGTITPKFSGIVKFTITGNAYNSVASNGVGTIIQYGTGTAPVNGAALTGTGAGGALNIINASVSANGNGFTLVGFATGLTAGTAYWFDLAVKGITAGGVATVQGINIIAEEMR